MAQIETASELWKELKQRMHLRRDNGRDNSLYDSLRIRLGCPVGLGIQSYLDSSGISAQQLLLAVLELSGPFARMFSDIWAFLSGAFAPKALETLRIRFGFCTPRLDFNLEQFRVWAETVERIIPQTMADNWGNEAYNSLFSMAHELLGVTQGSQIQGEWVGFNANRDVALPSMPRITHDADRVIADIRSHCQGIIYRARLGLLGRQTIAAAPMDSYYWMTDFFPYLSKLLPMLSDIPAARKDRALALFRTKIEPHINAVSIYNKHEPLELLNLPFWKERWHTYEIWATVNTLRVLKEYSPIVQVQDGYVAIDGQQAGIIARLNSIGHATACVAVQMQTPFLSQNRKAIRPDLSICSDDSLQPTSRAVILEFKQRLSLSLKHVQEVGTAYFDGSPKASGVIFLNYDRSLADEDHVQLPNDVYLFEEFQPGADGQLEGFSKKLKDLVVQGGLRPINSVTVLVDVSASLHNTYADTSIQSQLSLLLGLPAVSVFTFNVGIVSELKLGDEKLLSTSGKTELAVALDQLRERGVSLDNLVIVSDGGFEDNLKKVVKMFTPLELQTLLSWIEASRV